jgi:hypothetical protein
MKVVGINDKKEEVVEQLGYVRVVYIDGTEEVLQIDSFGVSEELPNYITMWNDTQEAPVGFFSHHAIKCILPLSDTDVSSYLMNIDSNRFEGEKDRNK